ncbi:MAG: Asp23/Gls24 family envelope stress response protein [Synergistaceae bacterium]|nr:Asp23/Gls24 family envelope stress response protein [Synergistaceae bacterium]
MDDLYKTQEPEVVAETEPEEAPPEETPEPFSEAKSEDEVETPSVSGTVHISEDVIMELAKKTLSSIAGVQPASQGIASKLGIGRKASDGIRVSVEDKTPPFATIDVYILVKYGLRIPDVAWDVQESIKNNLQEYTGYNVRAVNINVQGIYFQEKTPEPFADTRPEEEKPQEPTPSNDGDGETEKTFPPEMEQL